MASLDKLSADLVKAFEEKATHFSTWEPFESWSRDVAGHSWRGENTGLNDNDAEEFAALSTQYDRPEDFQNEIARYAQLAWSNARNAADPGPQPNAHLTGTPAEGDVMQGHPDLAPWPTGKEHFEEHGIEVVRQAPADPEEQGIDLTPQKDQMTTTANAEAPTKSFE